MEELLSLNIKINLIKIDEIWIQLGFINKYYGLQKNLDKDIISDGKMIYEIIIYIHNILEQIIYIYNTYKFNDFGDIIIVIAKNINVIEKRIKDLKKNIFETINYNYNNKKDENINIILSYMDNVIENGYIDFDEYKSKLFM